jgi:hypothetical protein
MHARHTLIKFPSHVMARTLGSDVVILDLSKGSYFGLDGVGARVWQLWTEKKTLGEICDVLVNEYDVARDVLEQDLDELASELQAQGLIEFG